MNDQTWAVVVGALVVIGLRVVDFFLPKGRMSKWAKTHSVKDDEGDEDDQPS